MMMPLQLLSSTSAENFKLICSLQKLKQQVREPQSCRDLRKPHESVCVFIAVWYWTKTFLDIVQV